MPNGTSQSVFEILFKISSTGEESLERVSRSINQLGIAVQMQFKNAITPLTKALNDALGAFPRVPPEVQKISKALSNLSAKGIPSVRQLTNLQTAMITAAQAGGPFSDVLFRLGARIGNVTERFLDLRAQQADLRRELGNLAISLLRLDIAFSPVVNRLRDFYEGAAEPTVASLRRLIFRTEEIARALRLPPEAIRPLIQEFVRLSGHIEEVRMVAGVLSAEVLRPMARQFEALLASVREVPPSLRDFQRAVEGFKPASATVSKLNRLLSMGTIATLDLAETQPELAKELYNLLKPLEAARDELAKFESSQRHMARTMSFLGVPRTEETTRALMRLQSVSHGVMLGTALASGNIRSLAFSLIFLRFSLERVVVKVGAAVAAFTILGKLLRSLVGFSRDVASSIQEITDRLFVLTGSMEETESAFRVLDRIAVQYGISLEDLFKITEALLKERLAGMPVLKATLALMRSLGIDGEEAVQRIANAIGREKANLDDLYDLQIAFTEEELKHLDLTNRQAVAAAVIAKIQERHGAALEKHARTISGIIGEARAAWAALWRELYIGKVVFQPILEIIRDIMRALYDAAKSAVDWAKAVGLWQGIIQDVRAAFELLKPALNDIIRLLRVGFVAAVVVGIVQWRIFAWLLRQAARMVNFLYRTFKALLRLLKPVWDAIRILLTILKPLWDWLGMLVQAAKEFYFNFTNWIREASLESESSLARIVGAVKETFDEILDIAKSWVKVPIAIAEFIIEPSREHLKNVIWSTIQAILKTILFPVSIITFAIQALFDVDRIQARREAMKIFGIIGMMLQALGLSTGPLGLVLYVAATFLPERLKKRIDEFLDMIGIGFRERKIGPEIRGIVREEIQTGIHDALQSAYDGLQKGPLSIDPPLNKIYDDIVRKLKERLPLAMETGNVTPEMANALMAVGKAAFVEARSNFPNASQEEREALVRAVYIDLAKEFGVWAEDPKLLDNFQYEVASFLGSGVDLGDSYIEEIAEEFPADDIGESIFSKLWEAFVEEARKLREKLSGLIGRIVSSWRNLKLPIWPEHGWLPPPPPPGGHEGATWGIPGAQHGLIVRRPTLVMAGEAGPEAVVPLGRARGFGTSINISITGNYILDDRTADVLARKVGQSVVRALQRDYQIGFARMW